LNFIVYSRLAALLSAAVLATARARASRAAARCSGLDGPVAVPDFSFADDTFAFPNMNSLTPPDDEPGLYAKLLLRAGSRPAPVRAVRPLRSRAAKARSRGYVERVNQIGAQTPWDAGARHRPSAS